MFVCMSYDGNEEHSMMEFLFISILFGLSCIFNTHFKLQCLLCCIFLHHLVILNFAPSSVLINKLFTTCFNIVNTHLLIPGLELNSDAYLSLFVVLLIVFCSSVLVLICYFVAVNLLLSSALEKEMIIFYT